MTEQCFKLMLFNYFVREFEADGTAFKMFFFYLLCFSRSFIILLYFQNKGVFVFFLYLVCLKHNFMLGFKLWFY